jgi:hypothetical protein
MPTISEIPDAHTLHVQLDAINKAIEALNTGSTVTNITVSAPPAPPLGATDGPPVFSPPIMILLEPPISDPGTISTLTIALQARADQITAQLVSQGYTDDVPTP